MTTITIQRKSANVIVKAVGGVLQPATSSGVTLNNQGGAISFNRLDQLTDVVEGGAPQDGSVLTYNASDDKYYVQPLNAGALNNQNLDGGTF